ncbi:MULTISPECIES: hypothetical protein [unclassified Pedobacter]|uniref:hypothetical protein n=1 Tax=unclassified Pedobacter TaxID=2628915 RepID=UPI001422BD73|nr:MULTISPECIES: hypothetical protein [unclassified Pedobacter]NII81979.1 hypothetical protein [Pedobacter sp. SG908]NMN35983.1 hypothetical protein [Pedobacter sp. SG918]
MKSISKRPLSTVMVISLGILFLASCKKPNDNPDNGNKISMKITVTVTGADQNDQVDFQVSAANHDASQYGAPVWKMNGISQGNQNSIIIDEKSFIGTTKTYVFETVKPFDFGELSITVVNLEGGPIAASYKTEVNGRVETNENVAVAADQSHNKMFTYGSNK